MEYFIVFIFGLIIGSFLNVCIYRMPLGKSIVTPRSFCPACGHTLRWSDNVPLLSYLVLAGKCRYCKKAISVIYPLVEVITAVVGVMLLYHFAISPWFFVYWFFACMLITVTFIDVKIREIPDVISLPGIFVGLALMTIFRLDGAPSYIRSFMNSFSGIVLAGGSMFLLGYFGEKIFKKEALGGGDVKLMAMIGAFLGWKLGILTFFLAPILGSIVGVYVKIKHKSETIAYGPYIALAAMIALVWGEKILDYVFVY